MGTDLAVRYESARLRIGDLELAVDESAFDDPRLLAMLSTTGLSGPARILRFLFSAGDYARLRGFIHSAAGNPRENANLFLRTILEGALPELLTLTWMAYAHPAEMEADFQRFYSMNLTEALKTESPRRLARLAKSLPAEGAVHRAANPDWQWGLAEHLIANLFDSTQLARWEAAKLAGAKPGKAPDQMARPGVTPKSDVDRVGAGDGFETIEEFDAWYAERKARMKPAPD